MEFSFCFAEKEKFTDLKSVKDGIGWVQAVKVNIKYYDLYGVEEEIEKIVNESQKF